MQRHTIPQPRPNPSPRESNKQGSSKQESSFTRWTYSTSDARSEPRQSPSTSQHIPLVSTTPPPLPPPPSQMPSPPPHSPSTKPVEREPGVWEQDDDILYSAEWPPVQEYLAQLRDSRRLISAPSEIVYTLAALSVLQTPDDALHWLFWGPKSINSSAPLVNRIALHKPRLIKTHVPWIGEREYRAIILSRQEKFQYVFLGNQWYPTSSSPNQTRKRALRSSGDKTDQDINDFFNLIDEGEPPTKRARKARKETQLAPAVVRPKRIVQNREVTSSSANSQLDSTEKKAANSIPKRSASPRLSPTLIPTISPPPTQDIDLPQLLPLQSTVQSDFASSHSRTRSISQDSLDTLVNEDSQSPHHRRSASVSSAETTVEEPPSQKKRKLDAFKEDQDLPYDIEPRLIETEGMVTRGRASKAQKRSAQRSETPSSRTSTPPLELSTKPSRTRTKPRKIMA